MRSKKLVVVVLIKKLFCRGFPFPYVISGVTINYMKFNCLTSCLAKKVCVDWQLFSF